MNIELSKDDVDFILALLERELRTVAIELHHARVLDYKQFAKEKEKTIEDLIARLKK